MRPIDADVLLEKMKMRKSYVGRPSDPVCLVEDAPTIGIAPVVHAHWIMKEGMEFCSNCRRAGTNVWDYCPGCGAKMDK